MSVADPRVRAIIRARHAAEKAHQQLRRHACGIDGGDAERLIGNAIEIMKRVEHDYR